MELTWGIAAIWLGLTLIASLLSIRFKMSVALVEILVGIAAGQGTNSGASPATRDGALANKSSSVPEKEP
jgi:Kef-type K+ transport system membrane component KefB